ncbi:protein farnesyltransferase subunit beta-like isoform X2 [Babylonia areolata]|uniref:protein farnesyltransferase subunit beta-like isoform X2 n=1 Tax=Babylonia areolata TaxID=304850 RepID=UPI003FCFAF0F
MHVPSDCSWVVQAENVSAKICAEAVVFDNQEEMAGEFTPDPILRCLQDGFDKLRFDNESIRTDTSNEQEVVEESCARVYSSFRSKLEIFPDIPLLERNNHKEFLLKGLKHLTQSYECLDASRPWLCYWILHSLDLLDHQLSEEHALRVADFLKRCQHPTGGFAGGPGQFPHLAPTYAAVNALCILAPVTTKVFDVLDRPGLYRFLMAMRDEEGAFKMHQGGEVDIRGAYCAASAARLTNMCSKELFEGTAEWICKCQTYEGGFAGYPGQEAHGGYSFCGLAALVILNKPDMCDVPRLLRWTSMRQMRYEGGFQGRTNKLVDGCYSFWQGGAFPILHMVLCQQDDKALSASNWMFDQQALQEYVLICCQFASGGLIDKPGKPRDHYHSCYCLSGLSVAQHYSASSSPCVQPNCGSRCFSNQPLPALASAHHFLMPWTTASDCQ